MKQQDRRVLLAGQFYAVRMLATDFRAREQASRNDVTDYLPP